MTFFARYSRICEQRGIKPCSQKAADMLGVTKTTISVWNRTNSAPKGETVAKVANALSVSTDYLLGRTDDPTDYTVAKQKSVPLSQDSGNAQNQAMIQMYNKLDEIDQAKVDGIVQGLLLNDKYKINQSLA